MRERISSAEVARAFDDFLERSHVTAPNKLHRVVAAYTGLHPTTVLRYHRQELESADAKVLSCLRTLEERLDRGESVFEDGGRGGDGALSIFRVSVHEVQRLFDRIIGLLGGQGRSHVYRYVARRLELHPTTVMRYHTGELGGAPSGIVPVLRELHRRIAAGDVVVLGVCDGDEVVPARSLVPLLDEIQTLEIIPDEDNGSSYEERLERAAGIRRGTLRRARHPGGSPFVKMDVYRKLADLRDSAIYDPCRHYEVGDRLHHHDLGTGTVIDKLHKSRILVEFSDGSHRLLREDVFLDPRWPHRQT